MQDNDIASSEDLYNENGQSNDGGGGRNGLLNKNGRIYKGLQVGEESEFSTGSSSRIAISKWGIHGAMAMASVIASISSSISHSVLDSFMQILSRNRS